jgi:hypothetical protein
VLVIIDSNISVKIKAIKWMFLFEDGHDIFSLESTVQTAPSTGSRSSIQVLTGYYTDFSLSDFSEKNN